MTEDRVFIAACCLSAWRSSLKVSYYAAETIRLMQQFLWVIPLRVKGHWDQSRHPNLDSVLLSLTRKPSLHDTFYSKCCQSWSGRLEKFSSCIWIQRSPNGPFQRTPSPLNNDNNNKESKSLALSPGSSLYKTPLLKSDNCDAIFPLWKSVHDPAFHWVAVVPLPELGWIVWNKLQSPFKERGRGGGGLWGGGIKAERIKAARAKEEDPTKQKEEFGTLVNSWTVVWLSVTASEPFRPLSLHPAPGLRVALQQHACAALDRDRSDPFVCFPNPGFAEID